MKTRLIFLLMGFASLTSCKTQVSEENIVGTWKVVEYTANIKDLSPIIIAGARELALTEVYTLNKNGTYQLSDSYKDEPQTGKWSLNTKGDEPYIEFVSLEIDQPMRFIIISYSDSEMKWEWKDKDLGSSEYTLQKN